MNDAAPAAGRSPREIRRRYDIPGPFSQSGVHEWDTSRRPTTQPPNQRIPGASRLTFVHDHFRAELASIQARLRAGRHGPLDVGEIRNRLHDLAGIETSGPLTEECRAYCAALTMHHRHEDNGLFPTLRATNNDLRPVLDQLTTEHRAIRQGIDHIDHVLTGFSDGHRTLAHLDDAFETFSEIVLSHFSYEERELTLALLALGF